MRAMMSRVAEEEASHAALGFELVRRFDTKLGAAARGRVRDAARVAVATLTNVVPSFPRLADAGVVPSREQHRALLEHLRANVWGNFTDRRASD